MTCLGGTGGSCTGRAQVRDLWAFHLGPLLLRSQYRCGGNGPGTPEASLGPGQPGQRCKPTVPPIPPNRLVIPLSGAAFVRTSVSILGALGAGSRPGGVQELLRQVRLKGCVWLTMLLAKDRLGVVTHNGPHWPFLSHVTESVHPHWPLDTIGDDDTGLVSFCGEGQHLPE